MKENEMNNTEYVISWVKKMADKYGVTVTCKDGEKLDLGQALCRVRYGKNWNTTLEEEGIESPDDESVRIAEKWLNGEIPNFVKE